MQTELLKSLLAELFDYTEEGTRVGVFACYSRDYDEFASLCKLILSDEKLKGLSDGETKIMRNTEQSSFFVEDAWGGKDTFTLGEILFFVDLWDKAQNEPFTLIYTDDNYSEIIATGITNNDTERLEEAYNKIAQIRAKKNTSDIF